MTAVSVFVCPGASQVVIDGVPGCTGGAGMWQSVELAEPFDPSMLSAPSLGQAFAAGWVVLGTVLAIIHAAKAVYRSI